MHTSKKMRRLSIAAMTVAGMIAVRSSGARAAAITDWDFDAGGAIAAPYNNPTPSLGSGSATQLGMSNSYTFAGGEGPGSIPFCDVLASSGASTGANSFGWRVRGPSNASGGGAGQSNGWNSAAPIATQGAQFSVSTAGFTGITLTFDLDTTNQAEANVAVLYSINGTDFSVATITSAGSLGTLESNTTSANTISGNYVKMGSGWDNQITVTLPASVNNDPTFAVEIVNASTGADDLAVAGTALNNSSGNWRYDNVAISGTAALPEPTSLGLLGLGALGLISRRRRQAR